MRSSTACALRRSGRLVRPAVGCIGELSISRACVDAGVDAASSSSRSTKRPLDVGAGGTDAARRRGDAVMAIEAFGEDRAIVVLPRRECRSEVGVVQPATRNALVSAVTTCSCPQLGERLWPPLRATPGRSCSSACSMKGDQPRRWPDCVIPGRRRASAVGTADSVPRLGMRWRAVSPGTCREALWCFLPNLTGSRPCMRGDPPLNGARRTREPSL